MQSHPDAWVSEIVWLIEEGSFEAASEKIEQVLEKEHDDSEALNLKGLLLSHKGAKKEATEYFERALDAKPDSGRLRAAILGNLQRPKEALQVIEAYLADHPLDGLAWGDNAAILTKLNCHTQAIDCLNKALQLNPNDLFAYKYKSICIKFLKDQFNTLICWVCNRQFQGNGIEPIPYWGIPTTLCAECYNQYLSASKTRHVTCIEKLENASSTTEGVLFAFSFGSTNKIVFEPMQRDVLPIIIQSDVISCQAVEKNATNEEYEPLSPSESKNAQYIRVDYLQAGKSHSLIFNVKKEYAIMLRFMQEIALKLKV